MFSGLRDPTMLGQSSSASICITAAAIVWWLLFAYCVATSIGGWFRGAIDCLNHHSHHFVMSSSVVKSIKNFFSNNNHDLIPVHVTTSNNATADSNTNATGSTSTTADSAFNGTNRRYWRKRGATRKRKLEEPCKKLFCTRQASKRGLCQVCFPKVSVIRMDNSFIIILYILTLSSS